MKHTIFFNWDNFCTLKANSSGFNPNFFRFSPKNNLQQLVKYLQLFAYLMSIFELRNFKAWLFY